MDFASIYGHDGIKIGADMLSDRASDNTDWNAVISGGIRGAAQRAISASVGEKFADGQLIAPVAAMGRDLRSVYPIAIIALGVVVLVKVLR